MTAERAARDALLRRLAWIGFVLMVLVTTSSAYLRLRAAGLGCDDWPRCYGQGAAASTLQHETVAAARVAHRISASAAGLVALLVLALAFTRRPRDRRALAAAVALLVLTVSLAYLGRATPQAQVAAVAMGNLLGGMSMSALFLFLALRHDTGEARDGGALTAFTLVALLLTALQLAYGAMTSASYLGLACTTFPDCAGAWWPADASWSAFDPWRAIAPDQTTANMTLHMIHRYGGALMGLVIAALGWALAARGQRALGTTLIVLVAVQWLIGIAMVTASLPVSLALLHNVVAGLLLATLAATLARPVISRGGT